MIFVLRNRSRGLKQRSYERGAKGWFVRALESSKELVSVVE